MKIETIILLLLLLSSMIPQNTYTVDSQILFFTVFFFLKSVDWWSLGILMFELLTGASPFTLEGERNSQSEVSK